VGTSLSAVAGRIEKKKKFVYHCVTFISVVTSNAYESA